MRLAREKGTPEPFSPGNVAAPAFTEEWVRRWMRRHVDQYVDRRTREADATRLAEAAAEAFDANDEDGPLDDPDHWIWTLAARVASEYDEANP